MILSRPYTIGIRGDYPTYYDAFRDVPIDPIKSSVFKSITPIGGL